MQLFPMLKAIPRDQLPCHTAVELSAADSPHIARTVLDITRQPADAVQMLLLLSYCKPMLGMLRSGKEVYKMLQMFCNCFAIA